MKKIDPDLKKKVLTYSALLFLLQQILSQGTQSADLMKPLEVNDLRFLKLKAACNKNNNNNNNNIKNKNNNNTGSFQLGQRD